MQFLATPHVSEASGPGSGRSEQDQKPTGLPGVSVRYGPALAKSPVADWSDEPLKQSF